MAQIVVRVGVARGKVVRRAKDAVRVRGAVVKVRDKASHSCHRVPVAARRVQVVRRVPGAAQVNLARALAGKHVLAPLVSRALV